ncbi:Uncharacterised protein [Sphingomonas paucimobilis]|nr:Uncharacterised protein [Sphingomonas paucimobilis]
MTIGDIDPAALWLAGGLALGIAELFVPGVFLIFLAIAAGVTALTVWAIPELPAVLQLVEFAVWSVVCVCHRTVLVSRFSQWTAMPRS